jgi:hypothetical protein
MNGWTLACLGIIIANSALADFTMKKRSGPNYRNLGGGISMDMNSIHSRGHERWANVIGDGIDYIVHMDCRSREFRLLGYNDGWVKPKVATGESVMVETACRRR